MLLKIKLSRSFHKNFVFFNIKFLKSSKIEKLNIFFLHLELGSKLSILKAEFA